jgi:peptide/nickel transport system permease protein
MSNQEAVQSTPPVRTTTLDQQVRPRQRFEIARRFARNKFAVVGLAFLTVIILIAALAPVIATHPPTEQSLLRRLQGPSAEHYFGTDELGRDVFSRVVHGSRYSLFIGFSGAIGGLIFGLTLGMLSGFFGGWVDQLIMRFIDIMLSFPGVLMAILIVSVLGPGLYNLIIALSIWFTPTIARLIRSTVLSLKGQDFVIAATSLGASNFRIMSRHLLPNAMSPLIVYGTLSVAVALLVAAGLSFLGLGAQPPTPEWGAMIGSGRQYLRDASNVTLFPGLAIFFTVLSLNFIGDALRDALDPRMKTAGRMSQQ